MRRSTTKPFVILVIMARLGNVIFLVFNCACDKGNCYARNQLHIKNFKKTTNFFLKTLKYSVTKDGLGNAMNIFLALLLLKVFISLTSTRDKFDSKLKFSLT